LDLGLRGLKELILLKGVSFCQKDFFNFLKINFLTVSLLFINIKIKLGFSSCHLLSKEG